MVMTEHVDVCVVSWMREKTDDHHFQLTHLQGGRGQEATEPLKVETLERPRDRDQHHLHQTVLCDILQL